jgi:hypothetical protein
MVSRLNEHDGTRARGAHCSRKGVAAAADALCALVQLFDVPLFLPESGLGVLVDALRRHLEKQTKSAEESELLLAGGSRETMARLDQATGPRRRRTRALGYLQGPLRALYSMYSLFVSSVLSMVPDHRACTHWK